MHFEQTILIDAPPERVWPIVSDVERWPQRTPTVNEVKLMDGAPFAVGSKATIKQPKLRPAVWEITRIEPGAYFEWRNAATGIDSVAGHRVEPSGNGSRVTLTIDSKGLLVPVMALFYSGLVRRYMRLEAEGFKAASESG